MKAILISIKPKYVAKILNGKKTIEIRKKFPSDYVGWVYIYCTKDHNNLLHKNCAGIWWVEDKDFQKKNKRLGIEQQPIYNGKVVAKFTLNKVEEIKGMFDELNREYAFENEKDLLDKSCLESDELGDYLKIYNNNDYEKVGYAWHIDNLIPFDKPKDISEFKTTQKFRYANLGFTELKSLTKAPQSFMFIEIE